MEPSGKKFRGAFGGPGPGVLSSGLWGCSHRVFGADRVLDTGYIYISSYCRMYPETALKLEVLFSAVHSHTVARGAFQHDLQPRCALSRAPWPCGPTCYMPTHRLHSSSFLELPYRILCMNPKKELLWSL